MSQQKAVLPRMLKTFTLPARLIFPYKSLRTKNRSAVAIFRRLPDKYPNSYSQAPLRLLITSNDTQIPKNRPRFRSNAFEDERHKLWAHECFYCVCVFLTCMDPKKYAKDLRQFDQKCA